LKSFTSSWSLPSHCATMTPVAIYSLWWWLQVIIDCCSRWDSSIPALPLSSFCMCAAWWLKISHLYSTRYWFVSGLAVGWCSIHRYDL
jgi:hypothetical protein